MGLQGGRRRDSERRGVRLDKRHNLVGVKWGCCRIRSRGLGQRGFDELAGRGLPWGRIPLRGRVHNLERDLDLGDVAHHHLRGQRLRPGHQHRCRRLGRRVRGRGGPRRLGLRHPLDNRERVHGSLRSQGIEEPEHLVMGHCERAAQQLERAKPGHLERPRILPRWIPVCCGILLQRGEFGMLGRDWWRKPDQQRGIQRFHRTSQDRGIERAGNRLGDVDVLRLGGDRADFRDPEWRDRRGWELLQHGHQPWRDHPRVERDQWLRRVHRGIHGGGGLG